MDLGVTAVLGTHPDALTGEAKVAADHSGESAHQEDPEGSDPLMPVGQETVDQGNRYEEEDSGSKYP